MTIRVSCHPSQPRNSDCLALVRVLSRARSFGSRIRKVLPKDEARAPAALSSWRQRWLEVRLVSSGGLRSAWWVPLVSSMEEPGAERSSSPSGSEDSEGESKHGDVMENGRESEEEHSKGEVEDSSSDSDGSGEDDSEHSAKSDQEDARNSGGGGGEESQGEEYGNGGGGGSSTYPVEGEAYPLADLPLEVITTVEPTNYAYPVLKNMSNGVLTHRNIFTEVERSVLVGIINKYRNIVDTRSRTREIYLEKQNVWQQIVEEYNSTDNIMVRTEKELRKCWDNMKYRAKQAEKEMFKVEVKAEGEAEVDIKMEPPDHDAFHFASGGYPFHHFRVCTQG